MWNLYIWGFLILFLIPGFVLVMQNIEIQTTIHARYAVTTVRAEFITGNSSEYVKFEMELIPEAIVSDFSVTADGYVCDKNLVDIRSRRMPLRDGMFRHRRRGAKWKFETLRRGIRMKENTQGYFQLTFEHQVLKNDVDNNFNMKIPVKTYQFYDHWSVMIDIIEDHRINRIKPYMEMYHNGKDISNNFIQNKKNVQNEELTNKEIILFEGTLTAPDNSNSRNNYEGYFSVDYTTNPGKKQIETYLSKTQIGVVISQNRLLSPTMNTYIVVLIDTSGSMDNGNLKTAIEAINEILLTENGGLTESDRVTFIKFNSEVKILGTFSGTYRDKKRARDILGTTKADGDTDINGAIMAALKITEDHIGRGSTDIPLIALFTDGKPEGPGIVKNTATILENIKNKNLQCTPIDSFAIGNKADDQFLENISKENCGNVTLLPDETTLKEDLGIIFEQVLVPVYSINHDISIESECVINGMIINDVTAKEKRKFANNDIDLINIPFINNISLNIPCEVVIRFNSTVANKHVIEELKICFHQGKTEYEKLTDISLKCNETIQTPLEVHEAGSFIDNLREYREKAKGKVKNRIRLNGLVTCKVVS